MLSLSCIIGCSVRWRVTVFCCVLCYFHASFIAPGLLYNFFFENLVFPVLDRSLIRCTVSMCFLRSMKIKMKAIGKSSPEYPRNNSCGVSLFCSSNLLFGDTVVVFAVVVCFNSPLAKKRKHYTLGFYRYWKIDLPSIVELDIGHASYYSTKGKLA